MGLVVTGLSHRTAPLALRERSDFNRSGAPAVLEALAARSVVREMVVLSTCNRAEIYAVGDDQAAGPALKRFFSDYHRIPADELAPHFYTLGGPDAARHLFRVTSGLDSLVVGEPQILGQVKAAYTASVEQHYTSTLLNRLFHTAFATGKRVRSETGLAEGAVSVSYAAVALARKIYGDLSALRVLVVGSGEMAKLTAAHLKAQSVREMTVVSRTRGAAEALAADVGAGVHDWEDRQEALASADIIVTATGAPDVVFSEEQIGHVMRSRPGSPVLIVDIAVPRDVAPEAGSLEQVFLYNLDDLQGIVQENLTRRSSELAGAERIVEEETAKFTAWMQSREIIPTVVALRQRFESIRRAELNRLQGRMSSLPPEAVAQIDYITRLIVEKLLLTPTEQLKTISDDGLAATYSDALNRLFELPSDPPEELAIRDSAPKKT